MGDLPLSQAGEVVGALEELVAGGLIRCCGWSTHGPDRAAAFAAGPRCAAVQHPMGERIAVLQAQRRHLRDKIDWYRGQLEPAAAQTG